MPCQIINNFLGVLECTKRQCCQADRTTSTQSSSSLAKTLHLQNKIKNISFHWYQSYNWLTYSSDKDTEVAISFLDKKVSGIGICWHIKWFVNSVSLKKNKTDPETFRAWHRREPTMGRVCWVLNHLSVNPPLPSSPLQVCSPRIFIETDSKWRNNLKGQSWNPPFKDTSKFQSALSN